MLTSSECRHLFESSPLHREYVNCTHWSQADAHAMISAALKTLWSKWPDLRVYNRNCCLLDIRRVGAIHSIMSGRSTERFESCPLRSTVRSTCVVNIATLHLITTEFETATKVHSLLSEIHRFRSSGIVSSVRSLGQGSFLFSNLTSIRQETLSTNPRISMAILGADCICL
jgi:hypothetical protein